MSAENVALVRKLMEAWNRGDFEMVIEYSTEDVEWVPALVTTLGGDSFHGHEGLRRFLEDWENTWETFEVHPQEFRDLGNQVLALTRVHAKGRGSGVELDQPIAQIFDFRDGLIARGQTFLDHQEAIGVAEASLEKDS
jgi:ketosteroid isomerase-like protein